MTPQRRAALVSVVAAVALIAIKLVSGLASGSLGLVAESLHSGTDLVAALLTFFAVGIAVKPADRGHQYGHGKAEHLAALAEASVLSLVSVGVGVLAVARLAGWLEHERRRALVGVRRRCARARDRPLADGRVAADARASTTARRCSRTPSTSGATSPERSRFSPVWSPSGRAGRRGTRSPRSSSRSSCSARRRG